MRWCNQIVGFLRSAEMPTSPRHTCNAPSDSGADAVLIHKLYSVSLTRPDVANHGPR